ncbi:DMT family transporter [Hydromonas duriensis]|uniref:Drug/metabolite transporter (DMT)-like permease n=1 Tax=Hydromonas duriensis TaxID=1527608 RepID=A0A4V3DK59_9BURK|nr:DMT family transporter [Hydromonas duriensis]TDR32503.1 drug/metabolite transporter (DMT)-like permease [Hydromonas duriensis]
MNTQPSYFSVYLKLIVATLLWGGTWVAAHILVEEAPPFTGAFTRLIVAVAILAWMVWRQEGGFPPLNWHSGRTVFWMGFTGFFLYSFFFLTGLQHISAGHGALIIALNPVLIALVAWLWFKEPMTALKGAGILTALAGCILVISNGHPEKFLQGDIGVGELLILGCVASWAAYTFIGQRATKTLSPLVATFYASAVGLILLGFASFSEKPWLLIPQFSLMTWLCLLYLGLFGTAIAYTLFTDSVKIIGAARAAPFINLTPIFGVLFSALLLNERLHIMVLIGGLVTITGVMMTVWQRAK